MRRSVKGSTAVDWQWVVGIVVSLATGGGVAALISAVSSRRKVRSEIAVNLAEAEKKEAEATEIINKAAGVAVGMLQGELCRYQKENEAMRAEIEALQKGQAEHERQIAALQMMFDEVLTGAHTLFEQVVELRGEPRYRPPERRKHGS